MQFCIALDMIQAYINEIKYTRTKKIFRVQWTTKLNVEDVMTWLDLGYKIEPSFKFWMVLQFYIYKFYSRLVVT